MNQSTTNVQHNLSYSQGDITTDTVSTPSRITINETGLYLVITTLVWNDTPASPYAITTGWAVNDTGGVSGTHPSITTNASDVTTMWHAYVINLSEGNFLCQVVGQNSGSTKTFSNLCDLHVARLVGPFSTASLGDEIDGGSP